MAGPHLRRSRQCGVGAGAATAAVRLGRLGRRKSGRLQRAPLHSKRCPAFITVRKLHQLAEFCYRDKESFQIRTFSPTQEAAAVLPLADCLDSTERWAVWSRLCEEGVR